MEKLLIVEDEKMIRQGIRAIVMRSPIHIDEIIECKNGLEAYEIIKSQKIDVMFTDIRMPKKDGITLVKEIQSLPNIPKVVIISGYDDFNYAVQLLANGAKDYILKPVERERINQILVKLESEIQKELAQKKGNNIVMHQQIKHMLLNQSIEENEISFTKNQFNEYLKNGEYVVFCTNYEAEVIVDHKNILFFSDINGHSIFLVKSEQKENLLEDILQGYSVGVSKNHSDIMEIHDAYMEALNARKQLFILSFVRNEHSKCVESLDTFSEEVVEKFIQMIGTNKLADANKMMESIIFKTKHGKIELDNFVQLMNKIIGKLSKTYESLLIEEYEDFKKIKNVYKFNNIDNYYEELINILEIINIKIIDEYDDYKNKLKIQTAINYIHDNYKKDLNMAVVSNYISMNYSLFSFVFKKYTNQNFVNYLKSIRMKEAKKMLEETDSKIIEISLSIGYKNEKHFMKTFRSTYGVTPSEYRKNIQVGKSNIMI